MRSPRPRGHRHDVRDRQEAVRDQLPTDWLVASFRVDRTPRASPRHHHRGQRRGGGRPVPTWGVDARPCRPSWGLEAHDSPGPHRRRLPDPTSRSAATRRLIRHHAELYETGVRFAEISTRLGIHPDAARTRWDEIRSRRGLTRRASGTGSFSRLSWSRKPWQCCRRRPRISAGLQHLTRHSGPRPRPDRRSTPSAPAHRLPGATRLLRRPRQDLKPWMILTSTTDPGR